MTLLRLKLRTYLGWGRHPSELESYSAVMLRVFRVTCGGALMYFVLIVGFLPVVTLGRLVWPPSPADLRLGLEAAAFILGVGILLALVPACTSWWLARRASRGVTSTIYGQCFAVRIDPPGGFYVRIGLTPDDAHWYSLPLAWDGAITPSDAQLELTVLEGTEWVERLRTLGAAPREFVRPVPQPLKRPVPVRRDAAATRAAYDDADATQAERQELRRFARHANMGWRMSSKALAANGWVGIVFGLLVVFVLPPLVLYLALPDPRKWTPDFVVLAVAFLVPFGLALIGLGIVYLRAWRRYRRFDHDPPATAEGDVLAWMPYRDLWSPTDWQQRKETLISVALPNGERHIFRIPIRYLHRVRVRGAHVRITYMRGTERVLDVARDEMPAQAPMETAPPD